MRGQQLWRSQWQVVSKVKRRGTESYHRTRNLSLGPRPSVLGHESVLHEKREEVLRHDIAASLGLAGPLVLARTMIWLLAFDGPGPLCRRSFCLRAAVHGYVVPCIAWLWLDGP